MEPELSSTIATSRRFNSVATSDTMSIPIPEIGLPPFVNPVSGRKIVFMLASVVTRNPLLSFVTLMLVIPNLSSVMPCAFT